MFQKRRDDAIDNAIKSWIVPKSRELMERGSFFPTAFLFTERGPLAHEGPSIATMILSDVATFHTQEHKDSVCAMITATAKQIEAWGVLVVCDTNLWILHRDAHERVGMGSKQFIDRITNDREWFESVRDRVGAVSESVAFIFETHYGDWFGSMNYSKDDAGYVWHPLNENIPDSLQHEGQFSNLLPPQTGPEVARA